MKTRIKTSLVYLMFLIPIAASAQFRFGVSAGTNFNVLTPVYQGAKAGAQSSDLYGGKPGFSLGLIARYQLSERLSLDGEVAWQMLPYSIKYETGGFYPSYLTASLAPVYKISSWLKAEAGIGSGLTLSSRFENKGNNDPLLHYFIGGRIPVKNFEFNVRYYSFFKPLYIQEATPAADRPTTKFYDHGVQVGLTYFFR